MNSLLYAERGLNKWFLHTSVSLSDEQTSYFLLLEAQNDPSENNENSRCTTFLIFLQVLRTLCKISLKLLVNLKILDLIFAAFGL